MSAAPRRYFPRGNDLRTDGEGEASTRIVPFKQADTCTGHLENNAKNAALYKAWQWPWLLSHFDRCFKCHVWGFQAKKLGLAVKCGVPALGLPPAGWEGCSHGVSPSQGNVKGAPGNSGHLCYLCANPEGNITPETSGAKSERLTGRGDVACLLMPARPPDVQEVLTVSRCGVAAAHLVHPSSICGQGAEPLKQRRNRSPLGSTTSMGSSEYVAREHPCGTASGWGGAGRWQKCKGVRAGVGLCFLQQNCEK